MEGTGETDSVAEGTGFEPSVPPRKRRPWREAPRPTIVVSRDDLCLMTPSNLSVRRPLRQQPRDLFARAGPMVRIRFSPARSLRTIGSVRGFWSSSIQRGATMLKCLFPKVHARYAASANGALLADFAGRLCAARCPRPRAPAEANPRAPLVPDTGISAGFVSQAFASLRTRAGFHGTRRAFERFLTPRGQLVNNVERLWNATPFRLRRVWGGVKGLLFHQMLHGVDIQPPTSRYSKSIGHQHVLEPKLRTKKGAHGFASICWPKRPDHSGITRRSARACWRRRGPRDCAVDAGLRNEQGPSSDMMLADQWRSMQ